MNKCHRKRVQLFKGDTVLEDAISLQSISLFDGESFYYDVDVMKQQYTFEYNKRRVSIIANVDSIMKDVKDLVVMVGNGVWFLV